MSTDKLKQLAKEYEKLENAERDRKAKAKEKRVKALIRKTEKLWQDAAGKRLLDALEEAGITWTVKWKQNDDEPRIVIEYFNGEMTHTLFFEIYMNRVITWGDHEYDLSSPEGKLKFAAEIAFQFKIN